MKRLYRLSLALVALLVACNETTSGPGGPSLSLSAADSSAPPDTTTPPDTLPPPPDTIPPDTIPPDTTTPPDSMRVARVVITPSFVRAAPGDSLGFFANLYARDGTPICCRNVRWSIGNRRVARIEAAGGQSVIVRALRPGETHITAMVEGRRDRATIIVRRR